MQSQCYKVFPRCLRVGLHSSHLPAASQRTMLAITALPLHSVCGVRSQATLPQTVRTFCTLPAVPAAAQAQASAQAQPSSRPATLHRSASLSPPALWPPSWPAGSPLAVHAVPKLAPLSLGAGWLQMVLSSSAAQSPCWDVYSAQLQSCGCCQGCAVLHSDPCQTFRHRKQIA